MARGRASDVIEVLDSDSDGHAAPASRHMQRPSEWAFLDSSDDDRGNDSDDFERPARHKKASPKKTTAKRNGKAKKRPAKTSAKATKAKQPRKSREYDEDDDEDDEEDEIDHRPPRVAVRHLFSDHLTVSELQAQEREMARFRALNVRSHAATYDRERRTTKTSPVAAKPSATTKSSSAAKPSVGKPSKKPVAAVGNRIGRTVLATTLARKQHLRERTPPSSPDVRKKSATVNRHTKRRRAASEDTEDDAEEDEQQEEEDEVEEDDESDDFEYDIVEAKRAALLASLELAKRKPKSSRLGIKTVVATPSPPPSPPPSPKARPTASKSKTAKKNVVTPPRKPLVKPKQAERKKRKVVVPPPPPAPLPRESRRKNNEGLLSDWLSVSELQAQEREWARLQRDLKQHEVSSPATTPVSKSKETTKSPRSDRATRSSRRSRANSGSSSDVSLVDIVELTEEDDDEEEDFAPPPRAPSKKNTKPKKVTQNKKKPVPKPSTPAVPRPPSNSSSSNIANAKPADVFTKPRTAAETVPHGTTWRAVAFKSAPMNLLPLQSIPPPFESTADKPLIEFDTNGDLDSKCRILPSFGKTKSFLLTSDPAKPALSQDAMNERVMELLETWTPRIKSCYERKCDAIVHEARSKIMEYVRLREETIQAIVDRTARFDLHVQVENVPVCPAERSLAKQLMAAKEISPLGVVGSIKLGRGDTFLVEKEIVPHKAIELAPVRQISRSTTYTGIKASVRVEDDPILRYVPYFGDNDNGDAIDVKAYDAVRAKESAEGAKSANGLDNEAHEYMLRLVIAEYGDLETVFNALKQVAGFGQPYTEYCEIKKRVDARQATRARMDEIREYIAATEKATGGEYEKLTQIALRELTKNLYPFADPTRAVIPLAQRLASQWTYFDTNLLPSQSRGSKDFRRLLGLRHTTDYADLSETFRDLFCRMCYKYDCPDHGIEHPMPTRRVDPLYPTTRFAPLIAKSHVKDEPTSTKPVQKEESSIEHEDGAQKPIAKSEVHTIGVSTGEGEEKIEPAQVADITDLASECSATTVESQETIDLSQPEPRRSSRSGTRASTLAQVSIESQLIAQGFKSRVQRSQRTKAPQKRANDDESEYLDDSHKALVSSKVKKFLKAGETCSESCWKAEGTNEETTTNDTDEFTEPEEEIKSRLNAAELLVLQKLRYTVGDNACMIASVLQSLTCRDIRTYLVTQQRNKPTDQHGYFSPDVSGKKNNRKRGRATAALPGNNRELLKRTRHQRLKDTSAANHEYEPCNHEGICDFGASCSCMKRDHMCEKACSCSRDCPNRFQGCKCSMGNCRTNQCPCFVALRECNPDLCHSCGASDVPVLAYNPEFRSVSSQELGICCNVNVQRGLHKRIGVSYSHTHGWGSFALEPIKKGEFIYEYVGAIISHDEAERRGSIYDKLNISFLFDLNEDLVADAVRTGNKSKFCNHANVGQKCHARIFRVGGEHHISIWALADIRKGEELFFNYGYHGESAPVWSQGARITESSKREAEEAAAASDGDDDAHPEIVTIE